MSERDLADLLWPMAIGFVLGRLTIAAWAWRARRPPAFSPNPASVMIGMLCYVAATGYAILTSGTHTIGAVVTDVVFWCAVCAPILFVVGPTFCIYVFFVGRRLPDTAVYAICAASLALQIYLLGTLE